MSLAWAARVAASMALLRASRALATSVRGVPPAPGELAPPCLPAADPTPTERAWRVRAQTQALRLIPVGLKFGLSDSFSHLTPVELPSAHRYPPRMQAPKALLAQALAIDVSTGANGRRFDPARWLGTPRAAQLSWHDDAAFVALRLQGPNPAWLARAPHLAAWAPSVPPERLFAVDYRELLNALPVRAGRYLYPCAALFVEQHGELHALGICLDTEAGAQWVAADGSPRWGRARRYFHLAELHVHEVVSHFLWTHVFGEKLLTATLRHLDERHPVRRLLAPHFAGTLQANENSGRRLLGDAGFFESCFSAGWRGVAELLRRGDALWRFERMVLPEDLSARGVTALARYPYRDDGLLYWQALERYVGQVVSAWFPDDAAVGADVELEAWSKELHGWLGTRGFPLVTGRAALGRVLTATLFNVVQHTLVNAQQYDAFGQPDLWPAALSQPFASTEDGLPTGAEAVDAVRATYGFSIQYNVLGEGLLAWHGERTLGIARALLDELQRIEQLIALREPDRPWPYRITLPEGVSNSINA